MLELRRIVKDYQTGDTRVRALAGITLRFRKNEFVSILGPSGCGKTTLLNIIGGLDQYTSGDLVLGGVSTKEYVDADWDTYRNHSIGFVFQSYNLIPHQTVLANVELALTLSGISPSERKSRAIRALRDVGLAAHINKRPSQLSGGQMQRVAIARALVNNPDIILADEPTGALDTTTSVQIMEILKKISRKKLIIMVTHNPELAKEYSSRIISMVDGRVTSDTNPCWGGSSFDAPEHRSEKKKKRKGLQFSITNEDAERFNLDGTGLYSRRAAKRKKSMSFFTALSLSLNNLMTKKARTFMVSFAGSIGIIGIALILSVSTGVNNYINAVQRDTLASYPIQLMAESTDLSSIISTMMETNENKDPNRELNKVYESTIIVDLMNSLNSAKTNKNDLTAFKKHLESTDTFKEYLTAVQYQYDFNWSVLIKDADGTVIKSDAMELINTIYGGGMNSSAAGSMMSGFGGMGSAMTSSFNVWQEMLPGVTEDEPINSLITEEYDMIYGNWPTKYNEVVLVVNKQNEISDLALYALGLRTESEIMDALMASSKGEVIDTTQAKSWSYEELCNMEFRLFLQSECYQKQLDGTYSDISKDDSGLAHLYDSEKLGINLKISGIVRPSEETSSSILSGTIAYTSQLTQYAIEKTAESELIQAQIATPETDILTGKPFKPADAAKLTNAQKKEAVINTLSATEGIDPTIKMALLTELICTPSEAQVKQALDAQIEAAGGLKNFAAAALAQQTPGMTFESALAAIESANMDDETLYYTLYDPFKEVFTQQYAAQMKEEMAKNPSGMMSMVGQAIATLDDKSFASLYDKYLENYSESTYENNLALLGNVSLDSPSAINLYCDTFEDKDLIAGLITEYNGTVEEEQQIKYTDYVALLMSSVTTIVDAITYVLIAFVAISLVVSSIMIGIITYISVLERTKEIGILRAIGASKKDIRRVFNAETLIVGFVAGALGIGITLGLNVVINIILFKLTGLANLQAVLPTNAAFLLVGISMALTLIAGIFPSSFAANRNPVEALRTD